MQLLLKPKEAAQTLAISQGTLRALTGSGDIPVLRVGRVVRYDVADLQKWVDANKSLTLAV